MWGVDSGALESIISFFYSGQCSLTFPSAVAVMDAANRLDVPSLSAAANSYVREALTVQTASTILSHSLQFKLADLTHTCLELVNSRCAAGAHRAGTSRAAAPPRLGTAWLICPCDSQLGAHPGALRTAPHLSHLRLLPLPASLPAGSVMSPTARTSHRPALTA